MGGPGISSMGFEDADIARTSLEEVSRSFEETVLVKRYKGKTDGSDSQGIADTELFDTFSATANISNLEARDLNYPNSIYAIGDLRAEFRIAVFGAESDGGDAQSSGRRSDLVIYRGRTYRFIGHVFRVFQNELWYYQGILRQVIGT